MEETIKNNFLGISQKNITALLFSLFFIIFVTGSIRWTDATVITGNTGHTLSGANANNINSSNSITYPVSYSLSGTLDIGDTIRITAMDGSGNTNIGSFVSLSGGESSGVISMNFSSGFIEGNIAFSGIVYTGGLIHQVIASGMTLLAILDTHSPIVSLVGSGNITIAQGSVYSESGATWTDMRDGTGVLMVSSSGVVNAAILGDYVLEYWKVDTAGNMSAHIARSVHVVPMLDTIAPLVTISSHINNATVTGNPLLSGLVSDTGGIANVKVNGALATIGSGSWSMKLSNLSEGANILTVTATDFPGNTGSTTISLNRVSIPSNIIANLSGATTEVITFSTDFSATGILLFGTGAGFLDTTFTGSMASINHIFTLTGLQMDTDYYFTTQGQGGQVSALQHFKTPFSISNTTSGITTVSGPIYLSGSSATGVIFTASGLISLLSTDPIGNSLIFSSSGLHIRVLGGNWDGLISPPERTNQSTNMILSGYTFTGNVYQIGNVHSELLFSGQLAQVNIHIGASLSGQTIKIYRSLNQGVSYVYFTSCVVTIAGDCLFTTDHLSLFAFAVPADTVPDVFSFSTLSNAELSTLYVSNSIVVSGITGQASISVMGGEYSINGAAFTSIIGGVHFGDTVIVRALSSSSYATIQNVTLDIGGVSSTFGVTTKSSSNSGGGILIGSGGPGGGGSGGGSSSSADFCINGDFSPSYYDNLCTTTVGNIVTGIVTDSFHIPAIFINNRADVHFRDINLDWAKEYILNLVTRGIIDNASFYRGDDGLTRAEFLKIVIRTTGWELGAVNSPLVFRDVERESWYETYVSLALTKGLIRNAQYFRPHDSITRAEVSKILMIALGVTVTEPNTMTFIDVSKSSDLAKYIEAAKFLNVFSGQLRNGKNIFRPNDTITRSEIAKVVSHAFGL